MVNLLSRVEGGRTRDFIWSIRRQGEGFYRFSRDPEGPSPRWFLEGSRVKRWKSRGSLLIYW